MRGSLLAVAIVLLELSWAIHPIFWGLEAFRKPKQWTGTFVTQDFAHHDENGHVKLKYEAEHVDNLVSIVHADLKYLRCEGTIVEFEFDKEEHVVTVKEGDILVAGPMHTCISPLSQLADPLLRHIESVERNGKRFRLETRLAEFHHVFKHASVHFEANKFPSSHFRHHELFPELFEENGSPYGLQEAFLPPFDPLGWLSNGVNMVGSTLNGFKNAVGNVARGMVGCFKEEPIEVSAANSSTQVRTDFLSFNYNRANKKADKPLSMHPTTRLVCDNCFVRAGVQVVFKMDVKDFKLQSFEFVTSPNFEGSVSMAAKNLVANWNYRTPTQSFTLQPTAFFVGPIPIRLNLTMATSSGVKADVNVKTNLGTTANFGISARVGVTFNASTGWSFVRDFRGNAVGGVNELGPQARMNAMVDVFPTAVFGLSQIGYVGIGLSFFVEEHITFDPKGEKCRTPHGLDWGISYTMIYGVGVNIGNLRWGIEQKSDPAAMVRHPISQGCMDNVAKNAAGFFVPTPFVTVGHLWNGETKQKVAGNNEGCLEIVSGQISATVIQTDSKNNSMVLLLAYNLMFPESKYCSLQQEYSIKLNNNNKGKLVPSTRKSPTSFDECSDGAHIPYLQLDAVLSKDLRSWQLKTNDNCWSFVLDDYPSKNQVSSFQ
jgi:hypothetical protein